MDDNLKSFGGFLIILIILSLLLWVWFPLALPWDKITITLSVVVAIIRAIIGGEE